MRKIIKHNKFYILMLIAYLMLSCVVTVYAEPTVSIPRIGISVESAQNPGETAASIQVLLMLTVLSLAPSILIMMTSFTRIIIILSFLRNALGTQQMPPNQVLIGFALFLTFFTMAPTISQINNEAFQPYVRAEISQEEAFDKASSSIKDFMFKYVYAKDLDLFITLSGAETPVIKEELPLTTVVPAFLISELKTAFKVGFLLFIPFLVIDMIVASTLMSMGMMMLPPVMISLPFKILLFVMVDGWNLITQSIIMGFK